MACCGPLECTVLFNVYYTWLNIKRQTPHLNTATNTAAASAAASKETCSATVHAAAARVPHDACFVQHESIKVTVSPQVVATIFVKIFFVYISKKLQ